MKKILPTAFLFVFSLSLLAQDYMSGKLIDRQGSSTEIYYDRTQNAIKTNVYQTVYKVFDKDKNLIYSVYLNNDRAKAWLLITPKPLNAPSSPVTVSYGRFKSGLIFNDRNNLDTSFTPVKGYNYLFSFTDTLHDYPVLHRIKISDGRELLLDPLSKLRIRKHNELVRSILKSDPDYLKQADDKDQKAKKDKELFRAGLLRLRDSLYSKSGTYAERVTKIRSGIEKDIAVLFKGKKVYADARRYEGDKSKGEAEGNGLFMANGNYYDGLFKNGKFVSGNVIIQFDAFEYCGEYNFDSLNGIGLVKYLNENYLLGVFKEGALKEGITYATTKTGEVYFGYIKRGQRTGYGELYNVKGEMYYGEFLNGQLIKGYSKDADPFGYFIYSRIEKGIKNPVDSQEGEEFFNPLISQKP